MIIIESLLITFEASIIYRGRLSCSKNWLDPQTITPYVNLTKLSLSKSVKRSLVIKIMWFKKCLKGLKTFPKLPYSKELFCNTCCLNLQYDHGTGMTAAKVNTRKCYSFNAHNNNKHLFLSNLRIMSDIGNLTIIVN